MMFSMNLMKDWWHVRVSSTLQRTVLPVFTSFFPGKSTYTGIIVIED